MRKDRQMTSKEYHQRRDYQCTGTTSAPGLPAGEAATSAMVEPEQGDDQQGDYERGPSERTGCQKGPQPE